MLPKSARWELDFLQGSHRKNPLFRITWCPHFKQFLTLVFFTIPNLNEFFDYPIILLDRISNMVFSGGSSGWLNSHSPLLGTAPILIWAPSTPFPPWWLWFCPFGDTSRKWVLKSVGNHRPLGLLRRYLLSDLASLASLSPLILEFTGN